MTTASTVRHQFPTTRWSVIQNAKLDPSLREDAVRQLLELYWGPLYTYARRCGATRERAQDIVQGFCARLLEREFLANLDRAQGSLRSYLRTALRNYLTNESAKDAAQKRGGNVEFVPLDFAAAENFLSHAPPTPERAFDHEWALTLLERTLERLREEHDSGQRSGPIEVLLDLFRFAETAPYAEIAEKHGMSVVQVKSFVHRARKRYRDILCEEIAETLDEGADVDRELEEILQCLT